MRIAPPILHDARKMDFSNPSLEKAHDEHWIEKQKILKLDLDSSLIKARGFDTIIENKVPQNRETRERMRKSRLKKLSNSLY